MMFVDEIIYSENLKWSTGKQLELTIEFNKGTGYTVNM